MKKNIIIIGAGHAGGMVAIWLRKKDTTSSITILGEENYFPYQRPPLSKAFIKKEIEIKSLYLKSHLFYKKNNIDVITDTKAIKIDKSKKIVLCNHGNEYKYDRLVLCTGSVLNYLVNSSSESNIFYLRNIDDALKIQTSLDKGKSIAVIGGGYIGLEVAAVSRNKGLKTTVLEMDQRIMSRSVSKGISNFMHKKHVDMGIDFILNTSVMDIIDHNDKKRIYLSNGEYIDVDIAIIGIGIKPNIELAMNAGLECENGIKVNEYGETSHESIFAAGDCTNHINLIFNRRLRVESVQNAVDQSRNVALSILGDKEVYKKVPWFWSEQYNIKLQIVGIRDSYDESIVSGDPKNEKFSIFYLKNNTLIAVEAINDLKSFQKGKKLIPLVEKVDYSMLIEK